MAFAELTRNNFALPGSGPLTASGRSEALGKPTPVFVVQSADVEVDKETGKVRCFRAPLLRTRGWRSTRA